MRILAGCLLLAACTPAPQPAPRVVASIEPEPAPALERPSENDPCRGGDLDLGRLREPCLQRGPPTHAPSPAELGLSTSPPRIRARVGEMLKPVIILHNRTSAPLVVDVPAVEHAFQTRVVTGGGRPATTIDEDGEVGADGVGALCSVGGSLRDGAKAVVRIELAPEGRARMQLSTRPTVTNRDCKRVPLPAGSYWLLVESPFSDGGERRTVRVELLIQ